MTQTIALVDTFHGSFTKILSTLNNLDITLTGYYTYKRVLISASKASVCYTWTTKFFKPIASCK